VASPTPSIKTLWDGWKGQVRYYVAFTAGTPDNLTDSKVIDISALSPIPSSNSVKMKLLNLDVNGDINVKLEFDNVASGTVDTATVGNTVTWVSGDTFDTDWVSYGNDEITINSVVYTISSVDSATQITLTSDPGDQTGVAYSVDEFIDRFVGQTNDTNAFIRTYAEGPNGGLTPTHSSSNFVGDLILTTTGALAGDEIFLLLSFKR